MRIPEHNFEKVFLEVFSKADLYKVKNVPQAIMLYEKLTLRTPGRTGIDWENLCINMTTKQLEEIQQLKPDIKFDNKFCAIMFLKKFPGYFDQDAFMSRDPAVVRSDIKEMLAWCSEHYYDSMKEEIGFFRLILLVHGHKNGVYEK